VKSPDDSVPLKIPIVLGVSGHLELDPQVVPAVKNCVRETLKKFKDQHPHTPLILLSPLAKGADQLVAEVAHEDQIAELFVVLPMPQAMYLADFDDPELVNGFDSCLKQRSWLLELPLLNSEKKVEAPGPERDEQYRAAGQFIVRHCQILIAIWDGKSERGTGGTAEVVQEQLQGLRASRQIIEPPEGFPVWRIPANRAGEPPLSESSDEPIRLYPAIFEKKKRKARAYFRRIFSRIETFNRGAEQYANGLFEFRVEEKEGIDRIEKEEPLASEEKLLLERYRAADALAMYYRRWTRNVQLALHVLVFSAFFLFVLFAHGGGRADALNAAGVTLLLAIALISLNRRLKTDSNYQDFRALAEALRVAFFWRFAGITKSVADFYLRNQRSELDWIRCGLRGWHLQQSSTDSSNPSPPINAQQRFPLILKHWVNAQRDYFHRAKKKNKRIARVNEIILALLVLGALAAGVMLLCTANGSFADRDKVIEHQLVVFDALLAAGALMHHFNERMAYHEHEKQFERMDVIFSYGSDLIDGTLQDDKYRNAQHWIYELGKQALAENGDWVLLHRERPVEVPHP